MVGPFKIGEYLVLVSGPSLNVSEAGAQWKGCFLGSTIQHLLLEAAGTGRRERCRGLGKLWGAGLFSAQPSSWLGQWLLWERVKRAVLTPLCDLCWTALGSQAGLPLPEQARSTELHVSCPELWPHFPHSLLLLHLRPQLCFLAGKPLKVIFYLPIQFRSSSESPLPPAK